MHLLTVPVLHSGRSPRGHSKLEDIFLLHYVIPCQFSLTLDQGNASVIIPHAYVPLSCALFHTDLGSVVHLVHRLSLYAPAVYRYAGRFPANTFDFCIAHRKLWCDERYGSGLGCMITNTEI